ncbi:ABC transporter permease [bacterium]|nr:ABC transporter permease [bacterium]
MTRGERVRARARDLALTFGLALLSVLALGLVVLAMGHDPRAALSAALDSSLSIERGGLEATLKGAVPLLLCGLAVAIGFRAGVFNLGAEGQLVLGAVAATAVGVHGPAGLPLLAIPAELLAGALAGAAWAGVAAWLKERRDAPEVLATILLNFVAIQLAAFLIDIGNPLNEAAATYPKSDAIDLSAELSPFLFLGVQVPQGIVLAVALAVALDFAILRTRAGLEVRLSGASPGVARATGFSPLRARCTAFLLGGALAGLAGALGVAGVTHRLYRGPGAGAGYTAVAVALVAGLRPAWVVLAALGFAALEAGGQGAQHTGVPRALAGAVSGLVVLLALVQGALASALAARAARRTAALEAAP